MSTLLDIFKRHGTDKWRHGYHAVYEKLPEPKRLLEVGVYKGASLRAWREWWPQTEINGVDDWTRGKCERIDGVNLISTDSRSKLLRDYFLCYPIDLLIDDGSHKPRDQAATFRNLYPLLAPGGRYFVEDVLPVDLLGEDNLPPWFAKRRSDFSMAAFLELANAIAESGGKLTRHDFRAQSGLPDSVLVEVRKPL